MASLKPTLLEVIAILQDDATIDSGISSPGSAEWLAGYAAIKAARQASGVWGGTP